MKKLSMAFLAAAIAATASGCIVEVAPVSPTTVGMPGNAGVTTGSGRAPIIQALDYSPKSVVGKDDAITFTIVANDVEGDVLQYNWASTKGLLSANSGQVVSWKAARADGSFEPGLTTVTVIISDGRSTTTGSVNIMIDSKGQATVNGTAATPAPSTAPASASPAPSATPSADASASPAASASPSASPSAAANTATATVQ
jgi:hypothetical protein